MFTSPSLNACGGYWLARAWRHSILWHVGQCSVTCDGCGPGPCSGHTSGWPHQCIPAWGSPIQPSTSQYQRDADLGFQVLAADKEPVLAFARLSEKPKRRLAVITNSDFSSAIDSVVDLGASARPSDDLLSGKKLKCVDGRIHVQLAPGECIVCEYERERQPPCANFRESKPTASMR